jgi:hypothetical protein
VVIDHLKGHSRRIDDLSKACFIVLQLFDKAFRARKTPLQISDLFF